MLFILTTCKNTADAKRIATMLLRLRLVACAKWWPVASSYWWKEKLVNAREVILFCEARKKQWKKIEGVIRRLHRDEIPCIVAWDVKKGSQRYMQWMQSVTR